MLQRRGSSRHGGERLAQPVGFYVDTDTNVLGIRSVSNSDPIGQLSPTVGMIWPPGLAFGLPFFKLLYFTGIVLLSYASLIHRHS